MLFSKPRKHADRLQLQYLGLMSLTPPDMLSFPAAKRNGAALHDKLSFDLPAFCWLVLEAEALSCFIPQHLGSSQGSSVFNIIF